MIRVAWICALVVLVSARIYERCELARNLMELGINPEDISTWVCIAYHESRFDTAASNPHSGDHGLFQISEIYWCGIGKACHLPCSALKDDDIADDLDCALQIHEEHTRLQGNGFLAWVVYPHHCKYNTKKYVVDCDHLPKNYTSKSRSRPSYTYDEDSFYEYNQTANYVENNDLLPAYLTVSSLFKANYGKLHDLNRYSKIDWYRYKLDSVDELKLPVYDESGVILTMPSSTVTYAPVKPWRTIETNQFRHKNKSREKTTAKPVTQTPWTFAAATKSTTRRPSTLSTTLKPLVVTSGYNVASTRRPYIVSTTKPTTIRSNITSVTLKPWINFNAWTFSSNKHITVATTKSSSNFPSSSKYTIATTKAYPKVSTTYRPFTFSTVKPILGGSSSSTIKSFFTTPKPAWKNPTITYQSRLNFASTATPQTTKSPIFASRQTTASPVAPKFTSPTRFTNAPSKFPTASGSPPRIGIEITQTTRTTQSIFDLYLNPTRRPQLPTYNFPSFSNNQRQINIFSGGTTTVAH